MSVTVQQAWSPANIERDNQNTNNASASVYFIAFDAANEAEALSAVENSAPDSFDGIPRKSVSVSDRLTETDWKIEVRYAFPSGGSGGGSAVADRDPSFSFDVSQGATRHITTPLAHKTKIPSSAPDSSAINDGEGIDIDASVCTFSETWWFPPNKITPAWKIKVASLYKKINSKKFRGFEPGDVRFEGCTGSRSGNSSSDYWQMTFKFAVQMNNKKTPLQIEDLGSVAKRGWDLLWIRYEEDIVTGSGGKMYTVKKPVAAYVDQIFEEADFRELGI